MALCCVSPRKQMQTPNISILLDLCLSISFFELSISKVLIISLVNLEYCICIILRQEFLKYVSICDLSTKYEELFKEKLQNSSQFSGPLSLIFFTFVISLICPINYHCTLFGCIIIYLWRNILNQIVSWHSMIYTQCISWK